jgi:hypothetical protein
MRRAVLSSLIVGASFGQSFVNLFDKAPPHIEQALRERINFFYQMHVEGKFRQADQAVHEDSKDVFFGAEKRKYKGFKLVSITYEENYTKAKVVVEVDDEFLFLPGGRMPVKRPISSLWKYGDAQWWWHVIPYNAEEGKDSPFGILKETPAGGAPPNIEAALMNGERLMKEIRESLRGNKAALELNSGKPSSDEITFTNTFQGPVKLILQTPEMLGLSFTLDKKSLEPGS